MIKLVGVADPVAVRVQADGFAVDSLRSASEGLRYKCGIDRYQEPETGR